MAQTFKTKRVIVRPNFDGSVYKGTFTIVDAEKNQYKNKE